MPLLPTKIVAICLLGLAGGSAALANSDLLGKPGLDGKPVGTLSDVEKLAAGPRTQDQYEEEERMMQEDANRALSRAPASEETASPAVKTESVDLLATSLFTRIHQKLLGLE